MSDLQETRRALDIASCLVERQLHALAIALNKLGILGHSLESIDDWQYDSYCHSLVGSLSHTELSKLGELFAVESPVPIVQIARFSEIKKSKL